MSPLCAVGTLDTGEPGHTIPGRHINGCPLDDGCDGCLPALAADGIRTCAWHESRVREALRAFPALWVDLGERPRLNGVSRAPDSTEAPSLALTDDPLWARSAIRGHLVTWCKILEANYGITLPDETTIANATRKRAAHHSNLAAQARAAAYLLNAPTAGTLHPDPAAAEHMRKEHAHHTQVAAAARENRETGQDVIAALADHVRTQLNRLLAHPEHAELITTDLTSALREGRRWANRSRVSGTRLPCPDCGELSYIEVDENKDITCRHCNAKGDATYWGKHAPPIPESLNLADLKDWLRKQGLHATERQLRGWADRGHLRPIPRDNDRDAAGRVLDRLFEPMASLRIAHDLLSKPRHERDRTIA